MVLAFCQALQYQFCQSLGSAHDVGGAYGLVGGDQHEGFHPGANGGLGGVPGAVDVVAHALDDIVFHQRDMLVGGGVVDRLHTKAAHDGFHPVFFLDGAQNAVQVDVICAEFGGFLQLAFDLVEAELVQFEQHDGAGAVLDDLATQLATDGTAGTGDHDHFVGNVGGHELWLGRDRVAPQQVFNLHVLDVFDAGLATQNIRNGWHGLDRNSEGLQTFDHLGPTGVGRAAQREQDFTDPVSADQGLNHFRAVDLDVGHHGAV